MFALIITGVKSVEEILTLEMSKSSRLWHQAKFLLIPCVPLMTHTQGGRFIFICKKKASQIAISNLARLLNIFLSKKGKKQPYRTSPRLMLLSTLQQLYCFATESTGHSWPSFRNVGFIYENMLQPLLCWKERRLFLLDRLELEYEFNSKMHIYIQKRSIGK